MKLTSTLFLTLNLLAMGATAQAATPAGRTPVLLELFTSEGCSSCPSADRLLEALDRTQPVSGADLIVLSEHVDYWNRLGWSDPFSSAAYSKRQQGYADKLGLDGVYTPQLVVDGRAELVGSDAVAAKAAIAKALKEQKVPIQLSTPAREGGAVKVHVGLGALPRTAVVYVALADNQNQSQVTRGENAGHMLPHVAVVRVLQTAGTVAAGSAFGQDVTLPLKAGVGTSGLRVVAFVQDQATGRVVGVAQERLGKL